MAKKVQEMGQNGKNTIFFEKCTINLGFGKNQWHELAGKSAEKSDGKQFN